MNDGGRRRRKMTEENDRVERFQQRSGPIPLVPSHCSAIMAFGVSIDAMRTNSSFAEPGEVEEHTACNSQREAAMVHSHLTGEWHMSRCVVCACA